jgi:hypothetical protein
MAPGWPLNRRANVEGGTTVTLPPVYRELCVGFATGNPRLQKASEPLLLHSSPSVEYARAKVPKSRGIRHRTWTSPQAAELGVKLRKSRLRRTSGTGRPMAAEDCRQDIAVKRMLRGSTVQRAPANKFGSHSNLGRRPQIAAPCAQRHGLNQVRSNLTLVNERFEQSKST